MKEDELITLAQAARLSGLEESTLRRAAQKKKLTARKIGRAWVTTPGDVKHFMAIRDYHKNAPKTRREPPQSGG